MAKKRYIITLTAKEREILQTMIRSGTGRARKMTRARILLKADQGWRDAVIATISVSYRNQKDDVRRRRD